MTIWPQLNHCQTAQAVRISGRGEVVEAPAPARKQTANKIRFNIDPPSDFCSRASDKRLSSVSVAQVSQKQNQGISRLFWFFLEHPMSGIFQDRSEEHTSELQSLAYLVCRLLLEKKNNHNIQLNQIEACQQMLSLGERSFYDRLPAVPNAYRHGSRRSLEDVGMEYELVRGPDIG